MSIPYVRIIPIPKSDHPLQKSFSGSLIGDDRYRPSEKASLNIYGCYKSKLCKINEQKWRFHHNRCPQSSKYTMRTSNQFYLILHTQRTSKFLSHDQFIASFFSAMVLEIINSILSAYISSHLKLMKLFNII